MENRELADNLRLAVPLWVQTEEDAETTIRALGPVCKGGRLLCVASGGDTPLALLAAGAAEVIGVDINPGQVAVAELKAQSIATLDSTAFDALWLAGGGSRALEAYRSIEDRLSLASRRALSPWLEQLDRRPLIQRGGMQGVGSELIALHPELGTLLREWFRTANLWEQKKYHDRYLAGVAEEVARLRQARAETWFGKGADEHTEQTVAREMQERFIRRFRHLVDHVPVRGNPYAAHMLLGYYLPDASLAYLTPRGREQIRPLLSRLRLVTGDLADTVGSLPSGSLDGADISNVTDLLGENEVGNLFGTLERALRPGGRVIHRNLIWDTPYRVARGFRRDVELSAALTARDRSFVYSAVTLDIRN
jgi:S-adenosylmethionine:diacylglycerol 3-amino-3-carboxypropyl transferase